MSQLNWKAGKQTVRVWYSYQKPRKGFPTLIFLHGWVQNHTSWLKVSKLLQKQGYGIVLIDFPGHGLSSTPTDLRLLSIKSFARLCSDISKKLKVRNVILIGHSLGGMVAQYAHQRIKPQALVLASTTYISPLQDISGMPDPHLPFLSALSFAVASKATVRERKKLIDFSKKITEEEIVMWLRGASGTNARALLACFDQILGLDSLRMLRKIQCPTLLVVGERDSRTPVSRMRKMNKEIQNSLLVVIPEKSHNINITAAATVARHINLFLQKKVSPCCKQM